jgi:hypothetical protein
MGKRDSRQMLTAVRKLCGQCAMGPKGESDQSMLRISAPISPPRTKKSSDSGGNTTAAIRDLPFISNSAAQSKVVW